jgi:predicted methyltransferase
MFSLASCNSSGAAVIEKRMRLAVKDAFFVNVLNDNPIAPQEPKQFDCITTSLVFESASSDHATYERCVKNVATLLKPGGVLLLEGDINESFYMVGNEKFFVLSVDLPFVRQAFEKAGFRYVYCSRIMHLLMKFRCMCVYMYYMQTFVKDIKHRFAAYIYYSKILVFNCFF